MNIDKVIDEIDKFHGFSKEGNAACDFTIAALEELQQYRQIGTVEERKTAVERNTPIPVMISGGVYKCPSCGSGRSVKHRYNYCPKCGQAINWNQK